MKLPKFLNKYFWDVDTEFLDAEDRANYVIERILENGDTDAVNWVFSAYPKELISEVLKNSRSLSLKSAHFWSLILGVPKNEILCFSKQFRTLSRAIWNR